MAFYGGLAEPLQNITLSSFEGPECDILHLIRELSRRARTIGASASVDAGDKEEAEDSHGARPGHRTGKKRREEARTEKTFFEGR